MRSIDLVLPGDPSTATGGYVYDRRIADGLAGLGWSVRVLGLPDDFPLASDASLAAADRLLDAIPDGRAVVIDGLALADLAASIARHAARLKLVSLVHHPLADETGLDPGTARTLAAAERRAMSTTRGVIVTSRWTARRLAAGGVDTARVRVVEPGTDEVPADGAPGAAPDASRALSCGPDAPPRLLCVATLTVRKGHAVLLDALARLRDKAWRLDCVGSTDRDRPTALAVRQHADRLGLTDRVALHGELAPSALAASYRRAAVFVLPSYLEGYGIALADALRYGLPIVSTDAGAIPDTVGDAGLLVRPGDAAALAGALARVLDDDALRGRLAANARERAAALPTWDDAARRFAAALDELGGVRAAHA